MELPGLLDHLEDIGPVVRAGRAGLMVDFDGTVSPIASTPDAAVISPVALEALGRITGAVEMVCVISGRQLSDLMEKVDLPGGTFVGNHGAEYLDGDGLRVEPGIASYRGAVARVLAHLKSRVDDPLIAWQNKSLAASIHYRRTHDPEDVARRLDAALGDAPGADRVESFWGKMVLELVAPLGLDKGHAVRKLSTERALDAVLFLGDDTTDATGMTAVRELREAGKLQGAAVAVLHDDTPDAVLRAADYTLPGIHGVERFLGWLANEVGQSSDVA
jgi:trehalose 6-phosphate phosphatase